MFERAHHQIIAAVLGCLDSHALMEHGCYFGGGTAIALRFGEYRESVDIDFLVSDLAAYRDLRSLLTQAQDLSPLLIPGQRVLTQAPLRADQYGVRTRVAVAGVEIKFEIVQEGRITLDVPRRPNWVCGVPSLTRADLAASKLLANSDRWMDDGVFSRDVIDLAFLHADMRQLRSGVEKAVGAYGDSALTDASRAVERLRNRDGWLERCMAAMAITVPRATLVQRLRTLSSRLETIAS